MTQVAHTYKSQDCKDIIGTKPLLDPEACVNAQSDCSKDACGQYCGRNNDAGSSGDDSVVRI